MTKELGGKLEKCHSGFLKICFGELPIDLVKTKVSEPITGYATNINEKINSIDDFQALLIMQREESEGVEINFQFNQLSRNLFTQNKNYNSLIFRGFQTKRIIREKILKCEIKSLNFLFGYPNSSIPLSFYLPQ